MRRITCSFITLVLDIHVFCLRAEAEGAILHATKRFEDCTQNLAFHVGGAKGVANFAFDWNVNYMFPVNWWSANSSYG